MVYEVGEHLCCVSDTGRRFVNTSGQSWRYIQVMLNVFILILKVNDTSSSVVAMNLNIIVGVIVEHECFECELDIAGL